jgi:hypothetical protein
VDNQQTDHDLLVRIDEQVKQMRISFDAERIASTARASKQDVDFETYKRDMAARLGVAVADIESLRMSRAQFYAITATISFVIGTLIKLFWR